MKTCQFLLTLAALAALGLGCETVDRARGVQRSVAADVVEYRRVGATGDMVRVSASAEEKKPRARVSLVGYTLHDFVKFACTNRPDVLQASLAVSNAYLVLRRVKADAPFVPHLSASGGYRRGTQNKGVHFGSHSDGDPWGSLDLDILIYDFGRYLALSRAAFEDFVSAVHSFRETSLAVFKEVSDAYFTLLMNDALLEAAFTNQSQYASHLDRAEELLRNQEAKKLDVLRARLDLSEARHKTISASNDVVTAELDFLKALGLDPDVSSRAELLPVASNCLASVRQELECTGLDLQSGLRQARMTSPALVAERARVRAASAEVDYRIADLMPELSLNATVSFTEKVWNWSWGSTLLHSIFTGMSKTIAVDEAALALDSARTAYHAMEQGVARDIGAALARRDTAREQLAVAKVSVMQARENLDTASGQLLVGDISRIDFSDAVTAYAESLGARVKAFYAGQMAEAEIVRLVGAVPVYSHKTVEISDL